MAKNTQEAEVIVTLNGTAAKKAISDMAAEYDRLSKAALEAYKAGNDALGKELDTKAQKLTKDMEITRRETKKFADVMKNINGATLKELRSAAKQLQGEINKLTPGTQEFITKSKQLQEVNTRIRQLTGSFKGLAEEEKQAAFSLKGLADGFNRYFGVVTTAIASITGLSMAFRKAAEEAAKLDDTYADVMKTTGLMHEEVEVLDKELMKLDTRTSREQLLLLARDAGKLGIQGKENILGFVRAADQIQVALGEDLGEGAIKQLGKIADVMGLTQAMGIEKSLLSIGSAVNAVGQASTASEAYLVEFTQRLAGVAAQTGISTANIIGFASGLDQSAMKVEMASTAFQKFLMKLYEDPAKFAAYANLEVEKFANLLKTDANQAVVTILQALNEKDGFASLVPIFKDMGLDGARAVSVLASMATNINAVTEAQALANDEFEKATSVTEEYTVKNNNLNAQLEKARKEFKNASIALGQSLNPILLKSTKATTYLIKALAQYGKEIKTVLIVIAALTVALKAKVIWMKVVATWNATLRTGSLALAAAQALLARNTTRAAAAWKLMNTAMKASVIGLVTAAVAGLVIMLQRLNKTRQETNYLEQKGLELDKKIEAAGAKEEAQVKRLSEIVHDQTRSYLERNVALEELKKLVPEYQASLTKEGELINDNTDALDEYIKKIKQAALEKLMADEIAELTQREVEAQLTQERHQKAKEEAEGSYSGDSYMGATANQGVVRAMETMLAADEVVLNGIAEERKQLTDKLQRMISAGDITIDTTGGGGGGSGGRSTTKDSPYKQAIKDLQDAQREEENDLKEHYLNNKLTTKEYQKQMREINIKYLVQKVELAKEYGEDETAAISAYLDAEIAAADAAQKELDALYKERDNWQKEVDDEFKVQQERLEWMKQEAEKIKESLLSQAQIRELDKQSELALLEELHTAKLLSEEEFQAKKQEIIKRYNQENLADDLDNLNNYFDAANKIASGASEFITALREAETASLEAEYQKQLTAAGSNTEKREAIEAEYEKKQLDLKKKYADTEMAINIAKTVANGAVAIIKTIAEEGWVIGGIMSALIAASTAAEVATIVAQRNAIKNTTVNSSGTTGGTGQRTITGYADGGYTEDHSTVTTVGERGVEWIAPHWMVRKNPVVFRNLESYRRSGSRGRSGSMSRGFADGGYTSTPKGSALAPQSPVGEIDWQALREFNTLLRYCAENGLFVKYGDILLAKDKLDNIKRQTSRN